MSARVGSALFRRVTPAGPGTVSKAAGAERHLVRFQCSPQVKDNKWVGQVVRKSLIHQSSCF